MCIVVLTNKVIYANVIRLASCVYKLWLYVALVSSEHIQTKAYFILAVHIVLKATASLVLYERSITLHCLFILHPLEKGTNNTQQLTLE